MKQHIVKRMGHTEPYDERKLYASIYAAAQSVREPAASAELIAEKVVSDVRVWMTPKHEVTSNDIRAKAADYLSLYNPDAGYMYSRHRIIW